MKTIGSIGPTRKQRTRAVALGVAAMIIIMLLTQLYGYEDFAATLSAVMPFNDAALLSITAAVIVVAELLTLPYLLGMYLSKLMRILSGCFAAGVSVFWLFTSLTNSHANNSALFSTTLELAGGIFAAAWALLLFSGIAIVIKADVESTSAPLEKKPELR